MSDLKSLIQKFQRNVEGFKHGLWNKKFKHLTFVCVKRLRSNRSNWWNGRIRPYVLKMEVESIIRRLNPLKRSNPLMVVESIFLTWSSLLIWPSLNGCNLHKMDWTLYKRYLKCSKNGLSSRFDLFLMDLTSLKWIWPP